jgi:hypothetical protein
MVKISVEVRSGAARFDVAVQAESIQQAVSFVEDRYPSDNVKVRFPIDPESLFVEDVAARTGTVALMIPERIAA